MDYETIANFFLTPGDTAIAVPTIPSSPARRLRDSVEVIATIGWWSREAADGFMSLGHGFFDGYVWGRAAALGPDVAPSVVVSAFGAFSAALLKPVYEQARTVSSSDAILRARSAGASAGLRAAAKGVDEELIVTLGNKLLESLAVADPGFRPLFGALQAQPIPEDPYGRLWRAAELFREHRGDSHLAACTVHHLGPAEMNVLTEVWLGYPVGEYSKTRGFSEDELRHAVAGLRSRGWLDDFDAFTDEGRAARDRIEALTDESQAALVASLGGAEGVAGVDTLVAQAEVVSAAVIAHRAAPADPRKRYAG